MFIYRSLVLSLSLVSWSGSKKKMTTLNKKKKNSERNKRRVEEGEEDKQIAEFCVNCVTHQ